MMRKSESQKAGEQRQDAEVLFAKMTAEVATLSAEYERTFGEYVKRNASPAAHPLVKTSLDDQRCGLCATQGEQVVAAIKAKIDSGSCPLCNSPGLAHGRAPNLLKELDSKLAKAKDELREVTSRRDRLTAVAAICAKEIQRCHFHSR